MINNLNDFIALKEEDITRDILDNICSGYYIQKFNVRPSRFNSILSNKKLSNDKMLYLIEKEEYKLVRDIGINNKVVLDAYLESLKNKNLLNDNILLLGILNNDNLIYIYDKYLKNYYMKRGATGKTTYNISSLIKEIYSLIPDISLSNKNYIIEKELLDNDLTLPQIITIINSLGSNAYNWLDILNEEDIVKILKPKMINMNFTIKEILKRKPCYAIYYNVIYNPEIFDIIYNKYKDSIDTESLFTIINYMDPDNPNPKIFDLLTDITNNILNSDYKYISSSHIINIIKIILDEISYSYLIVNDNSFEKMKSDCEKLICEYIDINIAASDNFDNKYIENYSIYKTFDFLFKEYPRFKKLNFKLFIDKYKEQFEMALINNTI